MVNAKPPAIMLGREITRTEGGAIALVRSAVTQFATAFNGAVPSFPASSYVVASGVFTDEFLTVGYEMPPEFDLRGTFGQNSYPAGYTTARDALYSNMQYARVTAQIARQALAAYAKNDLSFYRGMAMVTEAYTIIHLAEMFCSGIPLSEVSLDGDVQYRAGSPTAELLERAVLLLDSALAVQTDSTKMHHLARVAKGRALTGLGRYAEAGLAVRDVPDGFLYNVEHHAAIPALSNLLGQTYTNPVTHVPQAEGGNGIPWISERDPRVKLDTLNFSFRKQGIYRTATSPTPLASAIEARLIEVEAMLHAGDPSWLAKLNAIRTNGLTLGLGCPPERPAPCAAAGTGGVSGLPRLTDPGTQAGRITLLFNERAFWMFGTGHRQGDLRRLVRVYKRPEATVYPSGTYFNPLGMITAGLYGSTVAFSISDRERIANPMYQGCLTLSQ